MKRATFASKGARRSARSRREIVSRIPCVRCGHPVSRSANEHPRKLRCTHCRYVIYDYPRPCASLVVMKGESVLVLRRAHPPRLGYLDLPGGFMDAGEEIEQAARRELREETGLSVGRAEWLGFYWDRYYLRGFGYIPTMNFYFVGHWRSGTPRAADDAASADWVPLARLGKPGQRFAWKHLAEVVRDLRRRQSHHRRTHSS